MGSSPVSSANCLGALPSRPRRRGTIDLAAAEAVRQAIHVKSEQKVYTQSIPGITIPESPQETWRGSEDSGFWGYNMGGFWGRGAGGFWGHSAGGFWRRNPDGLWGRSDGGLSVHSDSGFWVHSAGEFRRIYINSGFWVERNGERIIFRTL